MVRGKVCGKDWLSVFLNQKTTRISTLFFSFLKLHMAPKLRKKRDTAGDISEQRPAVDPITTEEQDKIIQSLRGKEHSSLAFSPSYLTLSLSHFILHFSLLPPQMKQRSSTRRCGYF